MPDVQEKVGFDSVGGNEEAIAALNEFVACVQNYHDTGGRLFNMASAGRPVLSASISIFSIKIDCFVVLQKL